MPRELSEEWWAPFQEFGQQLFATVVEPHFEECFSGLMWELSLAEVQDGYTFANFGLGENQEIMFYLDVYEDVEPELDEDGEEVLYYQGALYHLDDMLSHLRRPERESGWDHGIMLDIVPGSEPPHVLISGIFMDKPVYIRLFLEPKSNQPDQPDQPVVPELGEATSRKWTLK